MSAARKKKSIAPTPGRAGSLARIAYAVAALISLGGLAETTYLTVAHLAGAAVVCGGSADCSTVLSSSYASIGRIPVAAFGAVAYFAAFSCATMAGFGYPRARRLLAITVGAMFAATLWLLVVQAFLLHTYCRYCLVSAAFVFVLAAIVVVMPMEPRD